MAATAAMHFGPEWMRAKPQPCAPRQHAPPSPPPQPASATQPLSASTYSALLAPVPQELGRRDEARPFRYTKDEMLGIYKEGGGRGGLNLEVERWEGIVRDVGSEPAGLREMTEVEKKLFSGPLNSELRRRQSTDFMNTLPSSDRQRLTHPNPVGNNSIRYAPFSARRRDSTDQPPLALPRKLSISNTQGGTLASPRDALPSPRNRIGAFGSGFDGVLNNGDSWSRRRPSASLTGPGGGMMVREGKEEDARHTEIKEEEENAIHGSPVGHDSDLPAATDICSSPRLDVVLSSAPPNDHDHSLGSDSLRQSMASLSLEAPNQPNPSSQRRSAINSFPSAPPGLTDPADIEWSYLDPQGQVQGPFRADLMQKWFDEGYFTPDLLIKRTHVDVDWIAVGILERRAAGGKIFFLQVPNGPPGLDVRTESPKSYSPVHEQNVFNGYQSIPSQTVRTTFDSSLSGTSPNGSPSSSLGGGGLGNCSSDPSAFGGRPGNPVYPSDSNLGGRNFTNRVVFQESISDARAFGGNLLGRALTIDTFNTYNGGGDSSPWSAGAGKISQGFNENEQHPYSNGLNGIETGTIGNPGAGQEQFGDATYNGMTSLNSHHDSPVARRPPDVKGISLSNSNVTNCLGSQLGAPTQFSQSTSVPYPPQQRQSGSPFRDLLPPAPEGPNVPQTPTSAVQPNNTPSWAIRNRIFESPAAPSPVVPPARPQASEWITQSAQPVDPSPWLMASLPVVDDVWREMPGPNSLTFSNLGQHDRLQQQQQERAGDIIASPTVDAVPVSNTQLAQIESANAGSGSATAIATQSFPPEVITTPNLGIQGSTAPKPRRKSTTRDVQVSASKIGPPAIPTVAKDQAFVPALTACQAKPVWAVEDDSKRQKGSNTTMSLKEIQEVEVKKAEVRKATEKVRERLVRANTAGGNLVEESQPFSSSWGLPTSQVGARIQIPPKEASITNTTSATPVVPVWTNATPQPTAKKTMKEIQEEEERRKKLAVKESMASAAARRASAETTVKVVPSAQASGGFWTTVGPNGKPAPPVTSVPRPPTNTSLNNSPPTPTARPNGAATRQTGTTAVKAASPRVEDFPITASHDFLKWLGESLKGLNSSVNLEEITSMLLSFPLDPDQSTLEIISDLIYANSTTLDGRRFAAEYVSKRKADAAARRGTAGISGSGSKSMSIADVVKTQPRPVQQEWGFKVVNKKKKGGRS